jgi:hypothetical protein
MKTTRARKTEGPSKTEGLAAVLVKRLVRRPELVSASSACLRVSRLLLRLPILPPTWIFPQQSSFELL